MERVDWLTICRLFAGSALLMTLSTGALIWLYGVVNGHEMQELGNGDMEKSKTTKQNGHVKDE